MKHYVLFIYTAPSSKVPHKLYYVNGYAWNEDKNEAAVFDSIEEAYTKQKEETEFDTFIEEV